MSQASLSRALTGTNLPIARLGKGRATLYGLYDDILGWPAIQPVYWVTPEGEAQELGELHHLSGGNLCWQAHKQRVIFKPQAGKSALPWQLAPLELRGFLGRQRISELTLAYPVLPADAERWISTQHLFAALAGNVDPRGAILVGEQAPQIWAQTDRDEGLNERNIANIYVELAQNRLSNGLPGRSSADGEQPKFISRVQRDGNVVECVVKFNVLPKDTPVGRRWHELLVTEQLAAEVLAEFEFAVARSRLIFTERHTFLESEKLDRQGRRGRRHMIALASLHEAFVPGTIQNWVSSVKQLAQQQHVSVQTIEQVECLYLFGGLIGNTDMHAGNLSFYVDTPDHLWKRRFRLAPSYDMLSMRWAPVQGVLPEYGAFDATGRFAVVGDSVRPKAIAMAQQFFNRLAQSELVASPLRKVAEAQLLRLHEI